MGYAAASALLNEMAASLSKLNYEAVQKQHAYNKALRHVSEVEKTAARAKIVADATEEWMEAHAYSAAAESLEEMIRAVKYHLRSFEVEFREGTIKTDTEI